MLKSRSWKSDSIFLSDNFNLSLTLLECDRESSLSSEQWLISPDFVVDGESPLATSIHPSKLCSNIKGAIGSTIDKWVLRNDNVATLLGLCGAAYVGDVQWLLKSGPWVSEHSTISPDDLNASSVELSHLFSNIGTATGGAIGGFENINENEITGGALLDGRTLKLDSLNWSEKEGDGSSNSNEKLHIFYKTLINY